MSWRQCKRSVHKLLTCYIRLWDKAERLKPSAYILLRQLVHLEPKLHSSPARMELSDV